MSIKTIIFLTLLVFIFTMKVTACGCTDDSKKLKTAITSEFEQVDAIFVGKVIKVLDTNKNNKLKSSADIILYTFEVAKFFKGKLETKSITIRSNRSGASCGYNFKEGLSYLVYASFIGTEENRELQTSICNRNQIFSNVNQKEIIRLKKLSDV